MVLQKIQTGKGKMGAGVAFFNFFSLKQAIKRLNTELYHFLLMILMGNDFGWIFFFFLTPACKAV